MSIMPLTTTALLSQVDALGGDVHLRGGQRPMRYCYGQFVPMLGCPIIDDRLLLRLVGLTALPPQPALITQQRIWALPGLTHFQATFWRNDQSQNGAVFHRLPILGH
jgi:hypothetical protein